MPGQPAHRCASSRTPLSGCWTTASHASSCSRRLSFSSWSPSFALFRIVGHGQADRTAAVDHGEIAIADQGLQRRLAVAELVGEQVFLRFQAGRLARDDLLAQGDHGLGGRDDRTAPSCPASCSARGCSSSMLLEIDRVPFAQLLAGDRVVIDLGGPSWSSARKCPSAARSVGRGCGCPCCAPGPAW